MSDPLFTIMEVSDPLLHDIIDHFGQSLTVLASLLKRRHDLDRCSFVSVSHNVP